MLQEVQTYLDARNKAYRVQLTALEALGKTPVDPLEGRYKEGLKVRNAYDKALIAARETLASETKDPLVKYIADHVVEDYTVEAITVLRALPATYDELQGLAADNGWCGTWDDLLAGAVRAGVVAEPVRTPERAAFAAFLATNFGLAYGDIQHAFTFVDAIVTAELKGAESAPQAPAGE